jgi:hypothetical protein
MKLLS